MAFHSVEEYILNQPERHRLILYELRKLIKETAPELQESIKWNVPCYGLKGNVCYLAAQSNHVNLGFYLAALLPDPLHLLEGTGANMRHVKIHSVDDEQDGALRELIRQAVKFQKSK